MPSKTICKPLLLLSPVVVTQFILAFAPNAAICASTSNSLAAKLGLPQQRDDNNPDSAAGATTNRAGKQAGGEIGALNPTDEVPEVQQRMCHADLSRNPSPQVVLAGAAKTGSTAIYTKLCTHPNMQCELASRKEPNMLRFLKSVNGSTSVQRLYDAYLAKVFQGHQPGAGNLTVDGSIWYYYYPNSRALLRRLLPCSKLVFIVRNPIHRARSNYFHSSVTKMSFEQYIVADTHLGETCNRLVGQTWQDMGLGLRSRFFKCLEEQIKKKRARSKRNDFYSLPHPLIVGYWMYFIQELRRRHSVHVLVHDDFESADDGRFGSMLDGLTRYLGISPFVDKSAPQKIDKNMQAARSSEKFARNRHRTILNGRTIKRIKPVLELQTAALEYLLGRPLGWRFDNAGETRANTTSTLYTERLAQQQHSLSQQPSMPVSVVH